jgi:hypothetical protein
MFGSLLQRALWCFISRWGVAQALASLGGSVLRRTNLSAIIPQSFQ